MEIKFNSENAPNAGKFISSLRHVGYDNYSAIADIIDNSIDAGAKNVAVDIYQENGGLSFIIVDDGSGMDENILDQALRLGSESDHSGGSLGKFGMGLSTASLSICRRTEVITRKNKNTPWLIGVTDVDEVIKTNSFVCGKGTLKDNEVKELLKKSSLKNLESGTIVRLIKTDQLQNTQTTSFANTLKKKIGESFREFIRNEVKFIVNEVEIKEIDPLFLGEKDTEVWLDDWYDIKTIDGTEKIRIRMALLPDYGDSINKEKGINIPNQGIYVLRNNRQILGGWWDCFTTRKHGDYNRFRAELFFSERLDNEMGVNFSKHGISPNQSIVDQIKKVLEPQLSGVRNRAKQSQSSNEEENLNHDEVEKLISSKASLLTRPIDKRNKLDKPDRLESGAKVRSKEKDETNKDPLKKESRLSQVCRFEHRSMTPAGVLYNPYQEGKVTVIAWNVDHPFYEKVMKRYSGDRGVISGVDFLIYSLATAELSEADTEDKINMLINLRTILSKNLRILLN